MPESNPLITKHDLERLRTAAGTGPVLIMTHNHPDPDGLASGNGLAFLLREAWGIPSELKFSGLIQRAENRAMVKILTPEWERYTKKACADPTYTAIALVDTQPLAGNNALPNECTPQIVFDHHHPLREKEGVPFIDVRPQIGATVTLIYQYLEAAGLVPDTTLATALFYGLKTDTGGLSRGTTSLDEQTYVKLMPLVDRRKLVKVEQADLSKEYFHEFGQALAAAEVFGNSVFAFLGTVSHPDFPAQIADLLIRLEDAQAALCLGLHGKTLQLSFRTKDNPEDAGVVIQKLVESIGKGGGHGTMAGGQISVKNRDVGQMVGIIQKRFLGLMGEAETEGISLT